MRLNTAGRQTKDHQATPGLRRFRRSGGRDS